MNDTADDTVSGRIKDKVKQVAEKAIGHDVAAWFRTAIQAGAVGVICHVFMSWSDRIWTNVEAQRETDRQEMKAFRDELDQLQKREEASRARAWEVVKDLRKSIDALTEATKRKTTK